MYSTTFVLSSSSSHDVGSVALFPQKLSRGLHEGLLPLLGVVPYLGRQSQDAHRVPGVHLGLAHRVQADLKLGKHNRVYTIKVPINRNPI